MSDRVQILIEARENASRVFGQVGRAAGKMGDDIQKAGRDASRAFREFDDELKQVGRGFGVLGVGVALAGRSFRDQEVALRTLERGYGDMADELEAFAEALQDTTNFSNDAGIAAANTFRTLADNYGFTIDQIQELITISADLAATMGIGLEDAAFRVQSAMRGEAEAAEFLGLTLNDRALGLDRVSQSMSEAERAQIRFNALQEQSAFALGTAAEQAETTYGAMAELRDNVQDAAQAFGEFLGPLGEIGAFAADNAVQIAAMGLAVGQLGKSLGAVRTLMGAGGIVGSLTSAGGIIAAVGLAEVAFLGLKEVLSDDIPTGGEAAVESFDAIIDKIVELEDVSTQSGAQISFSNMLERINEQVRENQAIVDASLPTFDELDRKHEELAEAYGVELDAGMAVGEMMSVLRQAKDDAATNNAFYAETADELAYAYSQEGEQADRLRIALVELIGQREAGLLTDEEAITAIENRVQQYKDEVLAAQEVAAATGDVTYALDGLTAISEAATGAFEGWVLGIRDGVEAAEEINPALEDAASGMEALNEAALTAAVSWREWITGAREASEAAEEITPAMEEAANAMSALNDVALGAAVAWRGGFSDTAEEAAAKAAELAETLRNDLAATMDLVTGRFTATTNALDAGFRVIVGNTNAIASQSQAVADWATELIDVEGTYSQLDDLLANHTITQQQYTAAQRAHNTILADNAMIQNDILGIQAESAPVLAGLMASQARYVNELQNAEAPAQALALAYMDTATSARALELAQIAASQAPGFEGLIQGAIAANPYIEAILTDMGVISRGAEGELIINTEGETEVEALTSAIESLEDTIVSVFVEVDDSALEGLQDRINPFGGGGMMGDGGSGMAFNIAVTADTSDADAKIDATTGKLSEWDGATATGELLADNGGATNTIQQSQDHLNQWGSSSGTGRVLADSSDATSKMSAAQSSLRSWGSSSASARVNATNNASGVIAAVSSQLAALNGRTATTYINTVYTTIGAPAGLGGVIDSYATGGVVARMGEWGTETLHFPNGGVAYTRGDGLYSVPQGTLVTPHTGLERPGGLTVNLNIANLYGDEDLAMKVSRQIVPAIQRAYQQHTRGYA